MTGRPSKRRRLRWKEVKREATIIGRAAQKHLIRTREVHNRKGGTMAKAKSQYVVVTATDVETFEKNVNDALADGFKLAAGFAVVPLEGDKAEFFQPVVKE